MWDTLEVAHIGTTQVKASIQDEMFKMEEGKSIQDFIQRLIVITNHLILLGRTFDNANLVHKILKSLIEEW